jgi:hypothetical protein
MLFVMEVIAPGKKNDAAQRDQRCRKKTPHAPEVSENRIWQTIRHSPGDCLEHITSQVSASEAKVAGAIP